MLMRPCTLYGKEHDLVITCPDRLRDVQLIQGFREILTEVLTEESGRMSAPIPCWSVTLRLCLVAFFLLSFFVSHAQQRENEKVRFMAKIETRNSFVQTHHATFLGVRAGFEFKFPVRCGLGYYWMLTNLDSKLYVPANYGQTDLTAQPRLRYAIGYVDYSFYEEDDWTLSVPVQIGVGESYYRSDSNNRFANGLVVPMEAGVSVDYLFTRWIGFGVGLGYRVMLKGNKKVKENFNSPYYQIRLNIAFSEIFRELKKKP